MALLSDTVGFVRRLPHQLVEAFRSTLEEVVDADLLVHVVDAGASDVESQIDAVREVLREIGASHRPELIVLNKIDASAPEVLSALAAAHDGSIAVSAATGEGIDKLESTIASRLRALDPVLELVVPFERGDVMAELHREGEILVEVRDDHGTRVRARIPDVSIHRFREFVVDAGDGVNGPN